MSEAANREMSGQKVPESGSDTAYARDEEMEGRKARFRVEMKTRRSALTSEERTQADEAICKQVCALPAFEEAEAVFAYLSFGAEVETRGIIEQAWRDGKVVALPRCTAPREMRWFRVADFAGLEKSSLGVEEPPIDDALEVEPSEYTRAIALVPGLTFDSAGYRLGYGGGFYDAFLSEFKGTSVGLCRSVQRSENLVDSGVIDTCDRAVDIVVSD